MARVDRGVGVVAVLADRLGQRPVAVAVEVGRVDPVAVLVDAIAQHLCGARVDGRVGVVAVAALRHRQEAVAVAVEVGRVDAVAVLVDAVARDLGRARVDARVAVVAVEVGGEGAIAIGVGDHLPLARERHGRVARSVRRREHERVRPAGQAEIAHLAEAGLRHAAVEGARERHARVVGREAEEGRAVGRLVAVLGAELDRRGRRRRINGEPARGRRQPATPPSVRVALTLKACTTPELSGRAGVKDRSHAVVTPSSVHLKVDGRSAAKLKVGWALPVVPPSAGPWVMVVFGG